MSRAGFKTWKMAMVYEELESAERRSVIVVNRSLWFRRKTTMILLLSGLLCQGCVCRRARKDSEVPCIL